MSARVDGVRPLAVLAVSAGRLLDGSAMQAQQRSAQPAAARSARADANVDLTGNWVSYVTEDWRFRMVTPPKSDYTSIPLNREGLRVAETWDWQKDHAAGLHCKAYGAAALLRMPTRLRISWQNDNALKLETDTGTQTRTLAFGAAGGAQPAARRASRTWQGTSVAEGAVQREHGGDRVLRHADPHERSGVARRHDGRGRSRVSAAAVHHDIALQTGA